MYINCNLNVYNPSNFYFVKKKILAPFLAYSLLATDNDNYAVLYNGVDIGIGCFGK